MLIGQRQVHPIEPVIEQFVAWLGDDDDEVRREAAKALVSLGERGRFALLAALTADSALTRSAAAFGLGEAADQDATLPLVTALRDADSAVRHLAAEALGKIRSRTAVAPLTELLHDGDPEVRVSAIQALGQIDDPAVADAVISALDDEHGWVHRVALETLGSVGAGQPGVVGSLIAQLAGGSDSDALCKAAASSLAQHGRTALSALLDTL